LLNEVRRKLGAVPNMFRLLANSPAVLEGYFSLDAALDKGALDARSRERIALAVAEINGCGYCLAAHTFVGRKVAKLDDAEIAANRVGDRTTPRQMPPCASRRSSPRNAAM
jgi:AhpD family alkylhydroperoxidase